MWKTVSGALSVLKMFKTALHGEKVVHIYWHTSAFSLRLRLSHAMHAITSNMYVASGVEKRSYSADNVGEQIHLLFSARRYSRSSKEHHTHCQLSVTNV